MKGLARFAVSSIIVFSAQLGAAEPAFERFNDLMPEDTFQSPAAAMLNGFSIQSGVINELGADFKKTGNTFETLYISADGTPDISIEKNREAPGSIGLGIHHPVSKQTSFVAADRDGDGALDFLEYSVLDDAGDVALTVIDYDATGQADFRIDFKNSSSEIWHDGRWFTVETRDGVRGIQYDDEFLVVENRDNRPIVVSE